MKKFILLIALIAAIIVAGCVGSNQAAQNQSQVQEGGATGNIAAIDSGASNVDAGVQQIDSTTPEADTTFNDSDLNIGI